MRRCCEWLVVIVVMMAFVGVCQSDEKDGRLAGLVVDARSKKPLPGVSVVVEGADVSAVTDQTGRIWLYTPTGTFNVTASKAGYHPKTFTRVPLRQRTPVSLRFEMIADSLPNVDSLVVYSGGNIVGKITDKLTGELVSDVNVLLLTDGHAKLGFASDLNGEYTFLNIPGGVYDIYVCGIGIEHQALTKVQVVEKDTIDLNIKVVQIQYPPEDEQLPKRPVMWIE